MAMRMISGMLALFSLAMVAILVLAIINTQEVALRVSQHLAGQAKRLCAWTALKHCVAPAIFYCIQRESFRVICPDASGQKCAVGIISPQPREDGAHTVITAYITDCRYAYRRLETDMCVPAAIAFIFP